MTLRTVEMYDSIKSSIEIPKELKSLTQLAPNTKKGGTSGP
jgi:hypothetical protein